MLLGGIVEGILDLYDLGCGILFELNLKPLTLSRRLKEVWRLLMPSQLVDRSSYRPVGVVEQAHKTCRIGKYCYPEAILITRTCTKARRLRYDTQAEPRPRLKLLPVTLDSSGGITPTAFVREKYIGLPYFLDALPQVGFRALPTSGDRDPRSESERSPLAIRKEYCLVARLLYDRIKKAEELCPFVPKE